LPKPKGFFNPKASPAKGFLFHKAQARSKKCLPFPYTTGTATGIPPQAKQGRCLNQPFLPNLSIPPICYPTLVFNLANNFFNPKFLTQPWKLIFGFFTAESKCVITRLLPESHPSQFWKAFPSNYQAFTQ